MLIVTVSTMTNCTDLSPDCRNALVGRDRLYICPIFGWPDDVDGYLVQSLVVIPGGGDH